MRALVGIVVVAALGAGCVGRSPGGPEVVEPPVVDAPDVACPGGPSCSSTLTDDTLLVGAAVRDVTPTGFEIARATFLQSDRPNACAPEAPRQQPGDPRCGELKDNIYDDCGLDGLCFTDEGYVAADADGTEGDGDLTDWFFDCGRDRICPDNVPEEGELATNGKDDDGDGAIDDGAYVGPDSDGSEGDGVFQGLWIAGYGNSRPAMGIKDALSVRAVVMRQGDSTLAVLTLDAVGLFFDEQERIKAKVEALRPGEIDLLLVQSTHTHEAPDTLGQWGQTDPFTELQFGPGRDADHMENIRTKGAEAIVEALDAIEPAIVRVGSVRVGDQIPTLVSDSRDPKIFNDTITAISFERTDDASVIATVVNWGNHPESLDSRNNFISADFPFAVRKSIEDGMPATDAFPERPARGGVGVYWQGAVGGLMGVNSFPITARDGTVFPNDQKTFARTDAYGALIAELALGALDDGEVLASTPLRFSQKKYKAPVENQVFHVGLFNGWFDRGLYDFDENEVIGPGNYPVLQTAAAVGYLGDIGFACAPGELFPESFVGFDTANSYGLPTIDDDNPNPPDLSKAPTDPPLRDLLGARFAMPLGLCEDEIGYLVLPYDYKLASPGAYIEEAEGDHYEETNSIGPQTIPKLMAAFSTLFAFEKARSE